LSEPEPYIGCSALEEEEEEEQEQEQEQEGLRNSFYEIFFVPCE
jgi:hypothetical protein